MPNVTELHQPVSVLLCYVVEVYEGQGLIPGALPSVQICRVDTAATMLPFLHRNGEVQQNIIQLEAPAVGLVRMGANIMVGCMNNVVHSYTHSGASDITCLGRTPLLV
jgi:hypothetical protein